MELIKSKFSFWFRYKIQHYNSKKYWVMRAKVINSAYRFRLIKIWYLFRIKKMDAFNNASFGTNYNEGAIFKTPPILPHGLNGIIIGYDVVVGENCTIHQQVTIQHGGGIIIGDNVFIGAGAKILNGSIIGDNVRIGANCVVFETVPDSATIVLQKPRIIFK